MHSFSASLAQLIAGMDAARHAVEIERLAACRSTAELDALVQQGGWLTPGAGGKRLKLVKHGSGTFLVVEYDDGWSTRVSQAPFR